MKRIQLKTLLFGIMLIACLLMILEACKQTKDENININEYAIQLKWNKAYPTETKQNIEIGLLWALSFLGADLPKGSFNNATVWNESTLFVDFSKLGFNSNALKSISKLITIFKQSEEYKVNNAIDLGRFIALTLNASNHYYAIAEVPQTISEFKQNKNFDSKPFAATNSTISEHSRVIYLPDSTNHNFTKDGYLAIEYNGKLNDKNTHITSYEVFEQMANGQLRFAIYDTLGQLITASIGAAGKPAKCLWCHEINIQTLYAEQTDEPNYYGAEQFKNIVWRNMQELTAYRNNLQSDIDFSKKQDHTFTELLYISFMEPSAERLALEWNMSIANVKEKLSGYTTHIHSEFAYLGNLYLRDEIEHLAPFNSVKAPSSAREKSIYEPNLLK